MGREKPAATARAGLCWSLLCVVHVWCWLDLFLVEVFIGLSSDRCDQFVPAFIAHHRQVGLKQLLQIEDDSTAYKIREGALHWVVRC